MSYYGKGIAVVANTTKELRNLSGDLLKVEDAANDAATMYKGMSYENVTYFLSAAGLSYVNDMGSGTIDLPAGYTSVICFDVIKRTSDDTLILAIGRIADSTDEYCVAFFDISNLSSPTLENAFKGKTDMGSNDATDGDCAMRSIAFSPDGSKCIAGGLTFTDTLSYDTGTTSWSAGASGIESGAHVSGACWLSNTEWLILVHSGGNWAGASGTEVYVLKRDITGPTDTHAIVGNRASDGPGLPYHCNCIIPRSNSEIAVQYAWDGFCVLNGNDLTVSNDNALTGAGVKSLTWELATNVPKLRYISQVDYVKGFDYMGGNWVAIETDILASHWVTYTAGIAETLTITPGPNLTSETHFTASAFTKGKGLVSVGTTTSGSPITLIIPEYAQGFALLTTLQQGANKSMAEPWDGFMNYQVDMRVIPTDYKNNSYIFKCTTGGAPGVSEPTWDTATGATTSDGDCEWICLGRMIKPVSNYPDYVGTVSGGPGGPGGGGGGVS